MEFALVALHAYIVASSSGLPEIALVLWTVVVCTEELTTFTALAAVRPAAPLSPTPSIDTKAQVNS